MKESSDKIPSLSIIIPVYNVEPYLEEALDSVLNQDYPDFEVIAINDGSTDQSGSVLDEYQKKDGRITVYNRKNSGLSATRNFGFKKAKGDYVYFFDSDDLLEAGALSTLLPLIKENDCDMVAFSGICINENSAPVEFTHPYIKPDVREPVSGEELLVQMLSNHHYSPVISMYIYKREFLIKHGLLFRDGYIHEDEAFTIQALSLAGKALSASSVHYRHRLRKDSIMAANPGTENVKGWTAAVSDILAFMKNRQLQAKTEKVVLNRARQLAHNSIKAIKAVNKKSKEKILLEDFFTDSELEKLGFPVRLRYKNPVLFRIYNRLNSIFSIR